MKYKNKTKFRSDIIKTWFRREQNISKTKLAQKLGVSRKTTIKLIKQYTNGGLLDYQRTTTNNFIDSKIKENTLKETYKFIENLNKDREKTIFIPTFNLLYQFSSNKNHMSIRTYQEIIKKDNFYVPSCNRKTKKVIRKRIKEQNNNKHKEKLDLMDDLDEVQTKRIYKGKKGFFGDSVEIDACQHPWFNDKKFHIYKAVDTFTGKILAMHAEKEETAMGYLSLLRKLFTNYGKPRIIFTDKRFCFWNGVEANGEIARIIKDFDIEIFASSDPTSKPNVERSFHNSQQLFPFLFHKNNIKTIEQVNDDMSFLTNEYNTFYQRNKNLQSSFIELPKWEIDEKLNLKLQRKVTKGNYVSIQGKMYAPFNKDSRIILKEGEKINIYSNEFNPMFLKHKNIVHSFKELSDKEVLVPISKEYKKLEFEKRKSLSFNKMIDKKMSELNYKEREIQRLLKELAKKESTKANYPI